MSQTQDTIMFRILVASMKSLTSLESLVTADLSRESPLVGCLSLGTNGYEHIASAYLSNQPRGKLTDNFQC